MLVCEEFDGFAIREISDRGSTAPGTSTRSLALYGLTDLAEST